MSVKATVDEGNAAGHELFMFTDNYMFEAYFYKGHSALEKLLDIIFYPHKTERDGELKLHIIHVTGTIMKSW